MSIFNENQEKVEGLGVVATALQNRLNSRAVALDGSVARNVISVESLDDAAKAELKNLGKNAKEALKDVTMAGLGLESYEQAEIPAHCMEAAQVALMGALGGAAEYQAAAYRMDVPSMEGATVFAPAIGGLHGSVDYTTASDQVSLEMFQDVDLNVVASFSATWNLGATRQDSFSEAWFKTIVLTPDQVALDIKVHRTLVQRGVQRKLNGAVSNWRQRNILGKRTAIPLLCRLDRAIPSKPSSNTMLGVTLLTGPNFSTVVLRTMASTLRISSSVSPEYALANGTNVRSVPGGPSHTAKV